MMKFLCAVFGWSALFVTMPPARSADGANSAKDPSFSFAGPFTSAEGSYSHAAKFPVPAGTYAKIVLDMDVTPGPWYPINPKGWHNLFWMVRNNRNIDMFGYAALRCAPDTAPQGMLRQGIGVPHPKKTKVIEEVVITPGTTYHIHYTYDIAGRSAELRLSNGTTQVLRLSAVPLLEPAASAFTFNESDILLVGLSTDIGANDRTAAEAPSVGWKYQNLKVRLTRAVP